MGGWFLDSSLLCRMEREVLYGVLFQSRVHWPNLDSIIRSYNIKVNGHFLLPQLKQDKSNSEGDIPIYKFTSTAFLNANQVHHAHRDLQQSF